MFLIRIFKLVELADIHSGEREVGSVARRFLFHQIQDFGTFCVISVFSKMGAPAAGQGNVGSWVLPVEDRGKTVGTLGGEETP